MENTKNINVKINGKDIQLENSSTVAELLLERQVTGTMFVLEKNLHIVPKEEYANSGIQEGDTIEIVGFFGGG